ncbi:MAG: hypothetical protein IAE95_05335 [Chitinophagaceae bacterium]|nr:hypothetical protein [Chitinophagaceae bacterium]
MENNTGKQKADAFYGQKTYCLHPLIARKKTGIKKVPDYRDEESENTQEKYSAGAKQV